VGDIVKKVMGNQLDNLSKKQNEDIIKFKGEAL